MTKKELIELLEQLEDNDEVFFSYPAGDYWHSFIVKPVQQGNLEIVSYSGYHEQLIIESGKQLEDDDKLKEVFVLG